MTIGLILTIIFAVMDYTGQIDWTWWQVCMPLFIELTLNLLAFSVFGTAMFKAYRQGW